VCSQPECQRHRRTDYHRRKIRSDPLYAQVVREKWRDAHTGYQKQYRRTHSEAAERNRLGQRQRDAQRRVQHPVRNNVALDLKRSPAQLWRVGPLVHDPEKNNVAPSNLLIFQPLGLATAPQPASLKRTPLWSGCRGALYN